MGLKRWMMDRRSSIIISIALAAIPIVPRPGGIDDRLTDATTHAIDRFTGRQAGRLTAEAAEQQHEQEEAASIDRP